MPNGLGLACWVAVPTKAAQEARKVLGADRLSRGYPTGWAAGRALPHGGLTFSHRNTSLSLPILQPNLYSGGAADIQRVGKPLAGARRLLGVLYKRFKINLAFGFKLVCHKN
jgi:hypothetical protein